MVAWTRLDITSYTYNARLVVISTYEYIESYKNDILSIIQFINRQTNNTGFHEWTHNS